MKSDSNPIPIFMVEDDDVDADTSAMACYHVIRKCKGSGTAAPHCMM
jgi:hypothetical protein